MASRAHVHYHKLSISMVLAVLLYNEFFAYFSAVSKWPALPSPDTPQTKRILLVADPQLQGFMDEPAFPIGTITRWDADRYLTKNFAWAVYEYKVDAIVFLGDLIDEASRTTERDTYLEYVYRFHSIYPSGSAPLMVYLSGDNDIGGEGEPVTKEKVDKFAEFFTQKQVYAVKDTKLEIVGLNMLTQDSKDILEVDVKDSEGFRFAVSHMPLVPPFKQDYTNAVLNHIQPDVVFSAHYHRGMDVTCNRTTGKVNRNVTFFRQETEKPIRFNMLGNKRDGLLHEINVPTCSYRMGVKQMAFGLAVVDLESGEFVYHNLWLPSRFSCLLLYLFAGVVSTGLFILGKVYPRRRVGLIRPRRSSGANHLL